ncbi:hypothetical protein [Methanobrevibacter smithii]|uniref:hypothetical protein n=1 Tax=Methanobrevibacter smithii TaxID=2173 RepID=UPI002058B3BE|nr:MAG TPA: hypothetical protein [Caudoviricetes sp.]
MVDKKFSVEKEIDNLKITNILKSALKRYIQKNKIQIKSKTELDKILKELLETSVEVN